VRYNPRIIPEKKRYLNKFDRRKYYEMRNNMVILNIRVDGKKVKNEIT
jgi:hypothetical protein